MRAKREEKSGWVLRILTEGDTNTLASCTYVTSRNMWFIVETGVTKRGIRIVLRGCQTLARTGQFGEIAAMGYGFMVWAVDIDALKRASGSKDDTLRRTITKRFASDLARFNDTFEDAEPNADEALQHIIDGTIPEGARGCSYAYAFKLLVQHFGTILDNRAVCPWSSPDFGPVDQALAAMGVPFRMDVLYDYSLPVRLPYPDDFPVTGWVDAVTVKAVYDAFSAAPSVNMDSQTAEIATCIRGWFRDAARRGTGLVSYYH